MLRSKILKIKYLIITSFAATSITLNAKIKEVKKKIFSKILINLAKAVSLTTAVSLFLSAVSLFYNFWL